MFGIGFGFIAAILLIVACIAFSIFIIYVPYIIAKSRDVSKDKKTIIIVLGWAGIFFGITWFIALVLAFLYEPEIIGIQENITRYDDSSDYIDKLEKLASLKEKGIITEEEFESKKATILEQIK